ncbi:MAG: type II toxin-antitoxin system RelE/ParE family toxin [Candidatus Competibacteraceae bacterium]
MQTIAEMPEFIRRAAHLLSHEERQDLIDHLAMFPTAGVIISGTGGIRKLRWGRQGMGKSGGVRVIYYFHNEQMPLYLLTVFGKGEKANLSKAERNELTKFVRLLVQTGNDRHD